MEITEIITRDISSGQHHRRYRQTFEGGSTRILVDERCQTDQSGGYYIVSTAPLDSRCEYCWPEHA